MIKIYIHNDRWSIISKYKIIKILILLNNINYSLSHKVFCSCQFSSTWLIFRPINWINIDSSILSLKPMISDINNHISTIHRNLKHLIIPSSSNELVCNTSNSKYSISLFFAYLFYHIGNILMIFSNYLSLPFLAFAHWCKLLGTFETKDLIYWPSIVEWLCIKYRNFYIFLKLITE